jgi:carbamoyl-phosphate synthase large subunit
VRPVTVLLSSAGRRVELLRAFRGALRDLGVDGRVLAVDVSDRSSAFQDADAGFLVPRCTDPAFVPAMLELCREQAVDLVLPTIDTELPTYALSRDDFAAVGTTVAVSSPEVVRIAADKQATHAWLVAQGFPTVRQSTVEAVRRAPADWPFPVVVKPRRGSAGIGVLVARDRTDLDWAARDGEVVVQSLARGAEHTVDALVDRAGRCVCVVPRRRLEVRSGEVSKGVTVRSAPVESLVTRLVEALPGAYGVVTVQLFVDGPADDPASMEVIELNARFGGGYPLAHAAGADYPRWLLEEVLGLPSTATADGWQDGLTMLRYDAAVFVPASAEVRS